MPDTTERTERKGITLTLPSPIKGEGNLMPYCVGRVSWLEEQAFDDADLVHHEEAQHDTDGAGDNADPLVERL